MTTERPKKKIIPLVSVIILFTISGITSTYAYVKLIHGLGPLLPGFIYTASTILLFYVLKIFPSKKALLYYTISMMLLWLATFLVTLASTYIAILAGIVTSGVSAVISMHATKMFISPFRFDRTKIFFIGSFSFLISDILMFIFSSTDHQFLDHFMTSEDPVATLFAESIFFWQLITGITLYSILRKSNKGNQTAS